MEYEGIFLELEMEDGTVEEYLVAGNFDLDDQEYIALIPKDQIEDEEGDLYIFRYVEDENGDPVLSNIESDEEYDRVGEYYFSMLEDEEE